MAWEREYDEPVIEKHVADPSSQSSGKVINPVFGTFDQPVTGIRIFLMIGKYDRPIIGKCDKPVIREYNLSVIEKHD